ncbi:probable RNA-directed DNA polymerase from transposon BS [Trichonephila clavipes]|nr:probable RNA-directed DNA polymerase from transposon BS [Trichonephila clavipes]
MNRLTREIRKGIILIKRRNWDDALVESGGSPNNIHKFIARMNRKPVSYPPLLGSQGLVFGTREKADLFVDTLEDSFQENRTPYDNDHIDEVDRVVRRFLRRNTPATPPLTSPHEISEIIKKLDCKKAPGSDQVKNIALKSLPINAITHLTKIINRCLLLNFFPKPWKHATIIMLPKPNKDLKFPINFRPISLISAIAKIYEKILLSRIQQHTTDNNIIPDFQHGFRKETSTCHQLLRVSNTIIHGFNHGKTTGGLFLDVEKAFDRLWHNGLIYKMINLQYPDYIIHTLADFLTDRTFQIKIEATISRTGQIQAGCPQGSILSPILYNIYTQDFPTSPDVEICLFADDAAIIKQADTPQEIRASLQTYLMKLKKWLKLWRISINTTKSRAIIFKKGPFKNKLQPLRLFGNSINWYDNVEYLGVVLDKRFTFKTHLDKITCKFKNRLRILHKLLYNKSKLSINNKRSIYLQYLLPIITYASPSGGVQPPVISISYKSSKIELFALS